MSPNATLTEIIQALETTVSTAAMRLPRLDRARQMSKDELVDAVQDASMQLGMALARIDALERVVVEHRIGHYTGQIPEETQLRE